MARALFAWELGGDLGHARRTLHVARELQALGHQVAFAFLDLTPLGGEAPDSAEWFQAPVIQAPPPPTTAPVNASEILLNRGFGDAAAVVGGLRGWFGLFSLWKPDVLVADYAPGALLAARAVGLKRIAIGTGFSSPPVEDPMPPLRNWAPPADAELNRADSRLVAGTAEAFKRLDLHSHAPTRAADLFRADATLLCTWPEIDPFGPRDDGAEYLGPQDDPGAGAAGAWQTEARPRVFAYLKPRDPRFLDVLAALRAVSGEAIVAAPGLTLEEAVKLSSPTVRVRSEALALQALLPTADLCLCHGGPGIVGRSLEAGVPLAILPMHVEQLLVGRRVASSGAGMLSPLQSDKPDLRGWLAEAVARQDLREAAAASTLRKRVRSSAAQRIARELA